MSGARPEARGVLGADLLRVAFCDHRPRPSRGSCGRAVTNCTRVGKGGVSRRTEAGLRAGGPGTALGVSLAALANYPSGSGWKTCTSGTPRVCPGVWAAPHRGLLPSQAALPVSAGWAAVTGLWDTSRQDPFPSDVRTHVSVSWLGTPFAPGGLSLVLVGGPLCLRAGTHHAVPASHVCNFSDFSFCRLGQIPARRTSSLRSGEVITGAPPR